MTRPLHTLARLVRFALLAFVLATAAMSATACGPGIAPGDSLKGFVLWGFIGDAPDSPTPGIELQLYTEEGTLAETTASDQWGKYVFAYHSPGMYRIVFDDNEIPVRIRDRDQQLDLNTSTGAPFTPDEYRDFADQP